LSRNIFTLKISDGALETWSQFRDSSLSEMCDMATDLRTFYL